MANFKAYVWIGISLFVFLSSQVLARDEERESNHLNVDNIHIVAANDNNPNGCPSGSGALAASYPSKMTHVDGDDIHTLITAANDNHPPGDNDNIRGGSPIIAAVVCHYPQTTIDNLSNLNHLDNEKLIGNLPSAGVVGVNRYKPRDPRTGPTFKKIEEVDN